MTDTPKQKYERTHETLWEGRQKNNRFDGPPKVGNTVTREDADRIQHLCDAFDSEKLDRAEHTEKKKNLPRKRPVGHGVFQYTLKNIKARSGVEKPVYPHMLRHNFVTVCKRDYELPNDTVKYLIGHAKDSRVMETTYSHLSGGEHTEKAMIASGVKEPEDEDDSALTPVKCTCGATNPPGARACANCGIVFTPDARNAQETLDESVKEAYRQTDPDDSETVEEIEAVEEALDDPETVDKLLDNEQVMDKLADKVAERMGGE
jgi:hypothetical protein